MLFNTTQFFLFLAVVLVLFYTAPRPRRKYLLLAASSYFYASWNAKFILLLLTLTAIDYGAGRWLERVAPGPRRKAVLIFSLAANLGFLGFFKYYNFLAANLALAMGRPAHSFFLEIVLPLGMSFHTFQSMSYVVDVYRGQQPAVRNPIDYALFISFFPQLVAGPIVRARNFFRDLWGWQPPSPDDVSRGVFLIALGLTKKMAFADQFAKVANGYFGAVAAHSGAPAAWSGVFAFPFPIYSRRPYLAASMTDFWRRWHISLSSWLRDYLYIPLGGSRGGRWFTYRNLMLTMLLGGLWHGASWNFLIWGGYQGTLLAIERALRGERPPADDWDWTYPFRAALTFVLALVGWVFFRAADLRQSVQVLGQMFGGSGGRALLEPWHLGLAALALVLAVGEEKWEWFERAIRAPMPVYAAALALMLFCLEIFGVLDAAIPFIYFQF